MVNIQKVRGIMVVNAKQTRNVLVLILEHGSTRGHDPPKWTLRNIQRLDDDLYLGIGIVLSRSRENVSTTKTHLYV